MREKTFLGISGVAGSGKDLFYSIFENEMKKHGRTVKRYALADALKEEVSSFTKESYGIDARTCSREEKEMIRPLLVFHGTVKRNQTKGRYWIDRLYSILDSRAPSETPEISCITDIRYTKYENDEVRWLKENLKGKLVHISQYKWGVGRKVFLTGANKEEESQDPLLKRAADYKLEWEFKSNNQEIEGYTTKKVINFIKWLSSKNAREMEIT